MLLEAPFEALMAQSVSLFHSQRQKQFRRRAITAQHFREQGQGGHAIDIVISEQHDSFVRIQRSQNPSNCRMDLREQKWIAQGAKARPQEILDFVGAPKLFPKKQPRDAF